MRIGLGASKRSNAIRNAVFRTLATFAEWARENPSGAEDGPNFTPSPMNGGVRGKEHAASASVLTLDIDGGLTCAQYDRVLQALAEYAALAWETRSSTEKEPRARIVVELSEKVSHEDYPATCEAFAAELTEAVGFPLQVDASCMRSEQLLFTPPKGHRVEEFNGARFAPPQPGKREGHEEPAPVGGIPEGRRDSTFTSVAGSMRRKGASVAEIQAALTGWNKTLPKPLPARDIAKIARSVGRYPPAESGVSPSIVLRSAVDLVENPTPARWLLRPYLEQDVLAVLSGEYGTFKSFLSLDWALHIAAGRHWHHDPRASVTAMPVVFMSAEGRGLAKRVSAWVSHFCTDETREGALKRLQFYAIEMAVDLSDDARMTALVEAIDTLRVAPVLIVVDTLTKNSSGVEEHNSAMQDFLNTLNASLRMRYRCSVLLIHHVGHIEKGRPRGPSSLVANTDAAFRVERAGDNLVLTTDRLKDSEVPEPLSLRAQQVALGTDDEGQPLSSLVLTLDGGFDPRIVPTGRNQRALWQALRESGTTSYTKDELSALARQVGVDRPRVPEAIDGLRKSRWLIERGNRFEFVRGE